MATTFTALVPMKGHSERVKNKNLRTFADGPLFAHILGALERSKCVQRTCVNTDSEVIAERVTELFPDVLIHWRPKEIRGDHVSMNRIIEYDIAQLEGDDFLQTHSTNPMLRTSTIEEAAAARLDSSNSHDSLFSVTAHQSRFYTAEAEPVNHDPAELLRTQDLSPLLEENSCLYLFTRKSFARTGARIGETPLLFSIPPLESIDIDTEEDFLLAESLFLHQHRSLGTGSAQ